MQEEKLLLEQIFISKKTITEMMIDRGYINTNSYLPFNLFFETFKDNQLVNNDFSLDMEFIKLDNEGLEQSIEWIKNEYQDLNLSQEDFVKLIKMVKIISK